MARVEDTCRKVPGDEAGEKGKDQDKFEGSWAQSEGVWTDCKQKLFSFLLGCVEEKLEQGEGQEGEASFINIQRVLLT